MKLFGARANGRRGIDADRLFGTRPLDDGSVAPALAACFLDVTCGLSGSMVRRVLLLCDALLVYTRLDSGKLARVGAVALDVNPEAAERLQRDLGFEVVAVTADRPLAGIEWAPGERTVYRPTCFASTCAPRWLPSSWPASLLR